METNDTDPPRDHNLAAMFDLDRSTLTQSMVTRMEEAMKMAQAASDDLKEIIAECKEQEFPARDIAAMKRIARLRLKDQINVAREQLEALDRIGKLVQFDLFTWADDD